MNVRPRKRARLISTFWARDRLNSPYQIELFQLYRREQLADGTEREKMMGLLLLSRSGLKVERVRKGEYLVDGCRRVWSDDPSAY